MTLSHQRTPHCFRFVGLSPDLLCRAQVLLRVLHSHDRMLRYLCRADAQAHAEAEGARSQWEEAKAVVAAAAVAAAAAAAPQPPPPPPPATKNAVATATPPPPPPRPPPPPPPPPDEKATAVAEKASALKACEWRASRLRLLRTMLGESRPTIWDLMQV